MATAMAPSKNKGNGPSLKNVVKTARTRPTRGVLYAVEGWGKTSFACQLDDPIVLMTHKEDGLRKLIENGLVPPTAHFDDEATTWNELLMGIQTLIVEDHPYKWLVLDVLNGAARLCVEHVTVTSFGGDAAKFNDYGRGWKVAPDEWGKLLDRLTKLNEKGMSILLLAHADVKQFKNPEGMDYDRYVPRIPNQLWEPTQEWADMILFGQLETFVQGEKKDAKKGKASGGQDRILYCQRTAVADAKNRHGLPLQIYCGQGADNAWNALANELIAAKERSKATNTANVTNAADTTAADSQPGKK